MTWRPPREPEAVITWPRVVSTLASVSSAVPILLPVLALNRRTFSLWNSADTSVLLLLHRSCLSEVKVSVWKVLIKKIVKRLELELTSLNLHQRNPLPTLVY